MCGKKIVQSLCLCFLQRSGLKKNSCTETFSPPPSHNPVSPLLTFILEENFGNETSGHPINIYTLLDSYNEYADS